MTVKLQLLDVHSLDQILQKSSFGCEMGFNKKNMRTYVILHGFCNTFSVEAKS